MTKPDRKGENPSPQLVVEPSKDTQDRPVSLFIEGLTPGEAVEIQVQAKDQAGRAWKSCKEHCAGPDGSLAVEPPESLALFWSMEPGDGLEQSFADQGPEPIECKITVRRKEAPALKARALRLTRPPQARVIQRPVDAQDMRGTFFFPTRGGPHPGILVLGGYDGKVKEKAAAILASHGFACLALAYFGDPPLPPTLTDVPLETVDKGLRWLAGQPETEAGRLGVLGCCKGAELALSGAAAFPKKVRALAAVSPSHVVWQRPGMGMPEPGSSWSLNGKPLDYVRFRMKPGLLLRLALKQKISLRPSFGASIKDARAVRKAAIPVEKIQAPLLLVSGHQDMFWPAPAMCRALERRLTDHESPFPVEHLSLADAGHFFGVPGLPSSKETFREEMIFGGIPEENARASLLAWEKILDFFARYLEK